MNEDVPENEVVPELILEEWQTSLLTVIREAAEANRENEIAVEGGEPETIRDMHHTLSCASRKIRRSISLSIWGYRWGT